MSPRNTQFSKEEIVDAAYALVRERGWGGFSVQAVAKAVTSSTMPIYSQFSNVRELEDAVVLKAFDFLKKQMLVVVTGDTWIDQAITFLRFAVDEKFLYRCMWDGRNPELQRECGIDLWKFIDEQLVNYASFAGFSKQQFMVVRYSRSLLARGLASSLNVDKECLHETGISFEEFIKNSSLALLEGFKSQFSREKEHSIGKGG